MAIGGTFAESLQKALRSMEDHIPEQDSPTSARPEKTQSSAGRHQGLANLVSLRATGSCCSASCQGDTNSHITFSALPMFKLGSGPHGHSSRCPGAAAFLQARFFQ